MNANTERLVSDVKSVVKGTEDMLIAGAAQTSERLAKLQAAAATNAKVALEKIKAGAAVPEQYVQANPWTAVGVSAAVGLIIGLLIGRR